MKTRFLKSLACLAGAFVVAESALADGVWKDLSAPARIPLEPGEGWWGGAFDLAGDMPITGEKPYVMDLREGCKFQGNASLFVSDRGRWIWSDDPCSFAFSNGFVTVELTRGDVRWGKAGETLKDACRYVSQTFQKPSGRHPDLAFFSTPQYCTWIELGYSQTQAAIEKYVRDIKANGFPPGVIMIDDTWQTDYGVWEFDARVFPDPKKLCDDLHRDGFKVMLWACSFVSPDSREYRDLQAKEGVLMAADRSLDFEGHPNTVLYNWWNGWSGVIDWSSPAGVKWATDVFQGLCKRYGIDGYKFDATNPRYFSMPNRRAYAKDATAADLSHAFAEFGEQFPMPSGECWRQGGRAIVVRLTDKGHTWKEAHRCISDMAAAGLMGCPFVLPDMVGGGLLSSFAPGKRLDQDLFVRSAQSQALSPMIQFSAAPWRVLDAEHLAAVKTAVALRAKFAPLFCKLAEEAGRTGEPILRSLEYVFPHQGYREIKDEFLMGDDLLVVPQLAPGTTREAFIPPGVWTADDGSVVTGPARLTLNVPLARIPYFVRTKAVAQQACLCGEAPERRNDFFWENDRTGFRAYGPGDVHKWSGIDVFKKGTTNNIVRTWLRRLCPSGNWHKNIWGLGMDDYSLGPGRGVGGVALRKNGQWLADYGDWAAYRVLTNAGDRCAFELDYRLPIGGTMTLAIELEKGRSLFHEAVSFSPDTPLDGVEVGIGLDLNPSRFHVGDLLADEQLGIISLFEQPHVDKDGRPIPQEEGSAMSAIVARSGYSAFADEPNGAKMLMTAPLTAAHANRRPVLEVLAGADWSEAGRYRTAAEWHAAVRGALASRQYAKHGEFVPPVPHPRLFATASEFAAARQRLETTELGRLGLARLRYEADATLKQPVLTRTLKGRRMLHVSQAALNRISKLALAWRLTGERAYADRALAEARAVAAFQDWNPRHFLDTAEMTVALALARDWLDDALSDNDKRLLTDAIVRKGLTTGDGETLASSWWVRAGNNWNSVCNASLSIGAEAVRDEYPSLAHRLLVRARRFLPLAAAAYADGNFPEGPSYWGYATDYHMLGLETLRRAFSDGATELFEADGLDRQADYPNLMTGPTGLFFNYSDAGVTSVTKRHLMFAPWYLAKTYHRADTLIDHDIPLYRAYCENREPIAVETRSFSRLFPFILLNLDEATTAGGSRSAPLCQALGGRNPVAVLRSGTAKTDWYVGIKAGTTQVSHSHLDEGSFVLDAGGVRWVSDLGCEDYGRIEKLIGEEIWGSSAQSKRWSIYRYATRGHNTLQIDGADLAVTGRVDVSVSSPALPSAATVDLTALYPAARRVVRTFHLTEDKLAIIDSLEGLAPNAIVTWRLHTAAKAEANGETVRLTSGGQTMTLTASHGQKWTLRDLSTMPNVIDSPNVGITSLTLTGTPNENGRCVFTVRFSAPTTCK